MGILISHYKDSYETTRIQWISWLTWGIVMSCCDLSTFWKWKFWDVPNAGNILPSFCHGVFRIGLGCVLWEVSLRVLATLHFANCGVLLFLIVYFKGGCFLFLEKVLGHIYDHLKLALCANLHNFFIMYTHTDIYIYIHMKIKKYSHLPCHCNLPSMPPLQRNPEIFE